MNFEASSESGHPRKDSFVYNQSMLLLPIYFAYRNKYMGLGKYGVVVIDVV